MNVIKATRDFERWLAKQIPLVPSDIAVKHKHMAESAFAFFRATFYRWLQLWHDTCQESANAPHVLSVGDLHIENFGTWRDEEGRLIWGINDLDEAWPGPYTLDLIRLTTSAYIAIGGEHLYLSKREAAEAIEEGYRDALNSGGRAFVLAEHNQWLRAMALSKLRDPVRFWARMAQNPPYAAKAPAEVRRLLEQSFPKPPRAYVLKRRIAGLGSLGHPRILALSTWEGAYVAREAKAIRTSAWAWYSGNASVEMYGPKLVQGAIRVQDPCVRFQGHWLVRRLAPDCSRIEIGSLPADRDEARLLYCMGWETANLHFGTRRSIPQIKRDLSARRGRWLHKSSKAMMKATLADWKHWREGWKRAL